MSFLSGTIGGGIVSCISAGIDGKGVSIDFLYAVLNGIPVGAQLSSFTLSTNLISSLSPKFKQIVKNKDKEQLKFYTIGGIGAALIYTSLTYPASIFSQNRKNKNKSQNKKFDAKEFMGSFVDRLGISIGFPFAMNNLQKITPHNKNSVIEWARQHALVCSSNVTAWIVAYPIHKIKYGAKLSSMISKYLKNTRNVMITGDCVSTIRPALQFLVE